MMPLHSWIEPFCLFENWTYLKKECNEKKHANVANETTELNLENFECFTNLLCEEEVLCSVYVNIFIPLIQLKYIKLYFQ